MDYREEHSEFDVNDAEQVTEEEARINALVEQKRKAMGSEVINVKNPFATNKSIDVSKEEKKNPIYIIILMIIAVLLFAGFVFAYMKNRPTVSNVDLETSKQTEIVEDEMANKIIYNNDNASDYVNSLEKTEKAVVFIGDISNPTSYSYVTEDAAVTLSCVKIYGQTDEGEEFNAIYPTVDGYYTFSSGNVYDITYKINEEGIYFITQCLTDNVYSGNDSTTEATSNTGTKGLYNIDGILVTEKATTIGTFINQGGNITEFVKEADSKYAAVVDASDKTYYLIFNYYGEATNSVSEYNDCIIVSVQ